MADRDNIFPSQSPAMPDNRSVLANGVKVLSLIAQALQDGFPTTVGVSTVSGLPAAATAGQGARRMVTDANSTTFNSVVAGGGTNILPVFSDGSSWRIG